ncbi:MAG: dephospho-CoA kinase [Kiritimatiellae bacterium]|nr:dephospho-CoA kinase [Kiritimatiellia bacterium]
MRSRLIAVTGGIACGKSTLAGILSEGGCDVLDTDDVSHSLQAPGGAAVVEIAGRFGNGTLAADGSVNRRKLGELVFADPKALRDLESIMHPLIEGAVRDWISSRKSGRTLVVLVPLLFEAGLDRKFAWDATVAVVSSRENQISRLAQRGFDRAAAETRIDSQMPCAEKSRRATFTIANDGSLAMLKSETAKLLEKISLLPQGV